MHISKFVDLDLVANSGNGVFRRPEVLRRGLKTFIAGMTF